MNTQTPDTKMKWGAAIMVAVGVLAFLLVASVTFFALGKNDVSSPQQINTAKSEKAFNDYLIVTGPSQDETVTLTLKKTLTGEEIEIPENLTLDTTRRIFSHVGDEGHDYTLTTDIRDKDGHMRSMAMKLSDDPMMIVINIKGFAPDDGLDLFVGPNNISTRMPMDWAGNLEQVIPLPLEPKGPFCLVMTDAARIETVRVCHELPVREKGSFLG